MQKYKLHKERTALKRMTYLIFQLGNLPLVRCVALQVVQHNLSISQKDFGPLQIFPQPLLRLHIPLANLNDTPASSVLFQGLWHMWALKLLISTKWHTLHQHARVDADLCTGIIEREHRAKEQPCLGCSAVCTPALFSRAALSACLRTPPPAAPPSVSAAGHVQKVSECDQLYSKPDKTHHKLSCLALLSTFPLYLQNSCSLHIKNTHYRVELSLSMAAWKTLSLQWTCKTRSQRNVIGENN